LNGTLREYYEDGVSLKGEATYVNGSPAGVSSLFHRNGKLKRETIWKDGEQVGNPTDYDDEGKPC
jgi:antitoxin component YwqK of YwqJK toxin-antitoxin module